MYPTCLLNNLDDRTRNAKACRRQGKYICESGRIFLESDLSLKLIIK